MVLQVSIYILSTEKKVIPIKEMNSVRSADTSGLTQCCVQ